MREHIETTSPTGVERLAQSAKSLRASWQLPRPVQIVIAAVSVGYLAVLGVSVANTRFVPRDLATFGLFAAASVVSIEVSLRLAWPRPRRDRIARDFLGVWVLPVMLLLPPFYAAAAVLLPSLHVQLRAWRTDPIKLVYTTAALGIARAVGDQTHSWIAGTHGGHQTVAQLLGGGRQEFAVAVAVAACWFVNCVLIGAAVSMTVGFHAVVATLRDREGIAVDISDTSMGLLATIAFALHPEFLVIVAGPVLYMQHQAFSGLRSAVRTDLLTDAASAQYWRDTADREVQRARASSTPLAVLMVDIDHFKQVNDRYGHIAGDAVLTAIARAIAVTLRPADLVGRLGGEEFAAVLTGSTTVDAEAAAQRVRANVAAVRVRTDRGEWVSVTVSAGVAALGVHGHTLTELLAAADGALYVAKDAGRNAVRIADAAPPAGLVIDLTGKPFGLPESAGRQ